jgi:DNA-binding response OmpR family regulator
MTESVAVPRILMVDDEPNVLDGYRRALRGRFEVVTANSGAEGLVVLQQADEDGVPFPVVVSDMMMPTMNGSQFLGQVAVANPAAVQMLLSGQADLESTITAVNNGNLFRFLTKPCAAEDLERALGAALEQHRLARAERELLEETLSAAVGVLTELLALVSSQASARTERVRILVDQAAGRLGIEDWRLPLATMLSQIGCIAVPDDVMHRAKTGGELSAEETDIYLAHPQTARLLLERIPRLGDVARWIGEQPVQAPGAAPAVSSGPPAAECEPAELVLRAGLAFLGALDTAGTPAGALGELVATGQYPRALLDALRTAADGLAPQGVLREFTVAQIRTGLLLEADVETVTGMTLVRKGERLSEAAVMRLENFARTVGVKEPIMVMDGV